MRRHATAQHIGDRTDQCDSVATRFTPAGERVYVLLDGIGSSPEVQRWTRRQAVRLAAMTARLSWPTEALRRQRLDNEAEADVWGDGPSAVAVTAQFADGELEVAWCGDARAYLLHPGGRLVRLTTDHNMRQRGIDLGQGPDYGSRNLVLSEILTTDGPIGTMRLDVPDGGRLLLASDGLYEPVEDAGVDLGAVLALHADPKAAAALLVELAISLGDTCRDNATCLVADLT
jgi:serine/threonine protein phosphatase PrpC